MLSILKTLPSRFVLGKRLDMTSLMDPLPWTYASMIDMSPTRVMRHIPRVLGQFALARNWHFRLFLSGSCVIKMGSRMTFLRKIVLDMGRCFRPCTPEEQ